MSYFQKLCGIIILIPMLGCNIFKGIDHPSTDAQYRAAAEACMDQGDIQCVKENLSKLSSNEEDVKLSLSAYTGMMEVGVTPAALMRSLYNTIAKNDTSSNLQNSLTENNSPFHSLGANLFLVDLATRCQMAQEHHYGVLITAVTKLIATLTAAQRQTLFTNTVANGFKISSPSLNAYVRFLSLVTFAAHILAEEQTTPFQFKQSDLVDDSSRCVSTLKFPEAPITQECTRPAHSNMTTGTQLNAFKDLSANHFAGHPTMFMIASSVDELANAINDLSLSAFNVNSLSDSLSLLSNQFGTNSGALPLGCGQDQDCPEFRAALIRSSIGDCQ